MTERELFKEAVMQYLVDDALAKRASKRRRKRPVARRILFAAACLLVAVSVTVFSIPSARAAVEDWLNGWFSPGGYFGQEKEDRAEEPTIEAIITSAEGNRAKVTEVGEGYMAYAEGFDMTLDEIAYDGETIFISGTMSGATARPFVEAQTGGDTFRAEKYDEPIGSDIYGQYCFCACENFAKFVSSDGRRFSGEIVPNFTDEMNAIAVSLVNKEPEVVFENGELVTSNREADKLWDAYLADHDVRFSIELQPSGLDIPPLSGLVSGELSFRMEYSFTDGIDSVPLLKATFGSIDVDATAYQKQTQTTQATTDTTVNLGGIHPVTITEWQPEEERTSDDCETYMYTRELDFSGASYTLKEISFTPTDTQITLHITLPETWSATELAYTNLYFHFLFDGQSRDRESFIPFGMSGPYQTYDPSGNTREFDCIFRESSIPPSQWATFQTLQIVPATAYCWDLKVSYDDEPQTEFSLRNGAEYTGIVNHTRYEYDTLYDEMTEYALTIHLDDYR